MADDHSQRPFRNTDLPSRATPTAKHPSAGGSDPLAELARLIGQNDPFGEFGRDGARQPAAPPPVSDIEPLVRGLAAQAAPRAPYPGAPAVAPAAAFPAEDFARQPFGSAPLAGGSDVYQTQGPVPGYEGHAAATGGYEEAGYDPNVPLYAGEGQEFYDDIPPPRRRMGVLAIAAVFALAVVGTAGAFGYRALFGSASSGPPPVIKADTTPSKVVPDKGKDQSAKLINDRVNDSGDQKLVSREERPVDLNRDKPAGVLTQDQSMANAGSMPSPTLGSGVIGSDPKKIKTITIRPDQAGVAEAAPAMPPSQANAPDVMPTGPAPDPEPTPPPAARQAVTPPASAPAPRRIAPERAEPGSRQLATASSNAPLALTPDAVAAPSRAAPARSTPRQLAPPAAAVSGDGYAVQVSSRRSEADAQAALQSMQSRFANVIGGQNAMVRRVDLGAKGVYYRAMVGPFGSSEEAARVCSELKAAGGSCFVQRN